MASFSTNGKILVRVSNDSWPFLKRHVEIIKIISPTQVPSGIDTSKTVWLLKEAVQVIAFNAGMNKLNKIGCFSILSYNTRCGTSPNPSYLSDSRLKRFAHHCYRPNCGLFPFRFLWRACVICLCVVLLQMPSSYGPVFVLLSAVLLVLIVVNSAVNRTSLEK
jgi:hypothetical protein